MIKEQKIVFVLAMTVLLLGSALMTLAKGRLDNSKAGVERIRLLLPPKGELRAVNGIGYITVTSLKSGKVVKKFNIDKVFSNKINAIEDTIEQSSTEKLNRFEQKIGKQYGNDKYSVGKERVVWLIDENGHILREYNSKTSAVIKPLDKKSDKWAKEEIDSGRYDLGKCKISTYSEPVIFGDGKFISIRTLIFRHLKEIDHDYNGYVPGYTESKIELLGVRGKSVKRMWIKQFVGGANVTAVSKNGIALIDAAGGDGNAYIKKEGIKYSASIFLISRDGNVLFRDTEGMGAQLKYGRYFIIESYKGNMAIIDTQAKKVAMVKFPEGNYNHMDSVSEPYPYYELEEDTGIMHLFLNRVGSVLNETKDIDLFSGKCVGQAGGLNWCENK